MKDVTGKTLADSEAARGLVDAVSGATPQLKAIYVSASLMAAKMIDEINANPNWNANRCPDRAQGVACGVLFNLKRKHRRSAGRTIRPAA
jgi:hypothetical protein